MKDEKKLTLLSRELTLEDIENVKSPALREILKEHFLQQSDELKHKEHSKYSEYSKYDKYSRFPYCGITPGD